MEFETVIGLEVHAQMKTRSKIFCGCSTGFGAPPNTQTCPVCLGMPGSLPVLNREVVESAIKLGLATESTINRENRFARKNYFYPDLPKGYQISQFELPVCEHGRLEIRVDELCNVIGITRIHMEEDAGKLVHDEIEPVSHVDLNRTGTPLLEIVSEPDMRSPAEAVAYLKKLHAIVRYLDICDGNMQEGSFRCDANISLRPKGSNTLGTRTELKNMNSFRNVQLALEYEERRQRDILLDGGEIVQQTMLWNPDQNRTEPMRGKEEAHDYRYFPDPDLVPLMIDQAWVDEVRTRLPELPDNRQHRFINEMDLPEYDALLLTSSRELADFFETALAGYPQAKKLANFIGTELLRTYTPEQFAACPLRPERLARLLCLVDEGTISGKIAKQLLPDLLEQDLDPDTLVQEKGLLQMSNEDELVALVREILEDNPDQVQQFRDGKTKVIGFFVGQLMQKTRGKANPQMANKLFQQELNA
ncbi:MAG: Asp-tRNA(Asn)/Glu-tRNA(Gln) amidotransferase GatCAB subunit B [Desulfobulbus propionicus]|nr:MAG: Asp-tRNA(Asn)/Glu-tRNA(Gln) amidotransferase GatCAB subunit B [Desulfobulbus propionicus]